MSDSTIKRCSRCGETKPATVEYFYTNPSRKDGFANECKICRKRYEEANKEKLREYQRQYRAMHHEKLRRERSDYWRENKERLSAKARQHYQENRETIKKQHLDYRNRNRGAAAQRTREWQKKNPDKTKLQRARHESRKRNLPFEFSDTDWKHSLEYFNHRCAICSRPRGLWHKLVPDHWIALADPRPDNPGTVKTNIIPLCHGDGGCNNSKTDRDAIEWLNSRFGKRKAAQILSRINAYFEMVKGIH